MKDKIYTCLVLLFVGLILFLGIWWTVFKFKDCKKVGHSQTYCVMKIFE